MKLKKITRENSGITYAVQREGIVTEEDVTVTAHEQPMPSFDIALDMLENVILEIMEIGESWRVGIEIKWLSISYTQKGTRQATIGFSKYYERTKSAKMEKTPEFAIEDGESEEKIQRECSEGSSALVLDMIMQAELYANGERMQTTLPIQEDPTEALEGDDQDMQMDSWELVAVPRIPDTDFPDWRKMEQDHIYWLISQYDDKEELKQDLGMTFDVVGKIDLRMNLESVKAAARNVVDKQLGLRKKKETA